MKIVVPVKLVPDLVEELSLDSSGTKLDTTFLRFRPNEFDEHALEQAILLKENNDAELTVIVPEGDGADDVLFTAAANGADQLIKVAVSEGDEINSHALARIVGRPIRDLGADLVLTGVQANDSFDGAFGPLLAAELAMPYVGYVSGVGISGTHCEVSKEFPGGWISKLSVEMPAVLGIQAAEQPPRYVAISKVRQAMKTAQIEDLPPGEIDTSGGVQLSGMHLLEQGERAEMFEGDEDAVADAIVNLLRDRAIL